MSAAPDLPPPTTLDRLLQVATDCTRQVAAELVAPARRDAPRTGDVHRKGEGDFVTEIDLACERRLRDLLLAACPEHGFLGEEHEPVRLDADFVWVVDPIDGTSNFAQGLQPCAVSVACLFRGTPVVGVAHCFPEDVTYRARAGGGAFAGDRALQAADIALDDASVLGVQWFRGGFEPDWMAPLFRCGARIRVFGSTVTQLCDVAAGRLHGNVQIQGRPWDFAAAALVATEAGCLATGWDGQPLFPLPTPGLGADDHHASVVAPPRLHARLLALLAQRHTSGLA